MNRKRKLNELYKGVFKNDKKSCLVDLKPLDKKRELEKLLNKEEEAEEDKNKKSHHKQNPEPNKSHSMNVSLKVNKSLGFGNFFTSLREEVVDIFMAKDDYISFEGLVNSNQINELFNGNFNRESSSKNFIDIEMVNLDKENFIGGNNNVNEDATVVKDPMAMDEDDDEIIYEDDMETIFKRKKPNSRNFNNISHNNNVSHKLNFNFDDNKNHSTINNHFDISTMLNFTNQQPKLECNILTEEVPLNNDSSRPSKKINNIFMPKYYEKSSNQNIYQGENFNPNMQSEMMYHDMKYTKKNKINNKAIDIENSITENVNIHNTKNIDRKAMMKNIFNSQNY
jgi:hypothetical protein